VQIHDGEGGQGALRTQTIDPPNDNAEIDCSREVSAYAMPPSVILRSAVPVALRYGWCLFVFIGRNRRLPVRPDVLDVRRFWTVLEAVQDVELTDFGPAVEMDIPWP